jgi:hypothetical protein
MRKSLASPDEHINRSTGEMKQSVRQINYAVGLWTLRVVLECLLR